MELMLLVIVKNVQIIYKIVVDVRQIQIFVMHVMMVIN